jgi:nucleolar protein 16
MQSSSVFVNVTETIFPSASYVALGLAASLNPKPSGGIECVLECPEKPLRFDQDVDMMQKDAELPRGGSITNSIIPQGHGRIIKDEHGCIIGLELGEEEVERATEKSELVEDRATVVTPETVNWVLLGKQPGAKAAQSNVIEGEHFLFRNAISSVSQKLRQCRSVLQR